MTDAYAQTATTTVAPPAGPLVQEPSPLTGALMPMLLIPIVFYFLVLRPQHQKIKAHGAMIKGIKRGDKVITGGGIVGTVVKTEEDMLHVEIAPDIKVKVMQDSIASVITRQGDAEAPKEIKEPKESKARKSTPKSANDN